MASPSVSLMDRAIMELEVIWEEERSFWQNYLDKDGNFTFVFGSAVRTDVSVVWLPDGTPKAYISHESDGRVYITLKEQEALVDLLELKAKTLLRPGPSQDVVRFACIVFCFLSGLLPYNHAMAVLNVNRYHSALDQTASRYHSAIVKEISTLQQSEKDQLNRIKQEEQKLADKAAKAEAERLKAEAAVRASTSSKPSVSVEIDVAPISKPTVLTMSALEKAEANANASAARHIAEASSSSSSVDAPPASAKKQPTLVLKSKKGAKRTLLIGTGLVAPKVNPSSSPNAKHSKAPKSYNIAPVSEIPAESEILKRKGTIEQWKARRELLERIVKMLSSREDFQHASQQGVTLRYENEKAKASESIRRRAEEQRNEANARAVEALQQQKRHDAFRKIILDKLAGPMDSATEAILRRKPSESDQEFFEYLANVYGFQSHMILWQKAELTGIPAIITAEFFEPVQEINFSENKLSIIPPGLLSLPNLRRLFLHTNKIRKLPMLQAATITLAKSLQLLDLHDNLLTDLEVSGLEELQILDCEKNELREFPIGIEQCEKLQHLNLSRNQIKIVPIALGSFANKKLSYLRLRCNPITNLPAHIYLKGLRATMEFLVEHGASSLLSATSRSDSLISDLERRLLFNPFLADVVLQPSDDAKTSFPAHTCILSVRCKSIVPVLNNLPPLPEEPYSAGTPKNINVVVMKAAADELRMLLEYIYCDRFTAPTLDLVQVNLEMGAAAVSVATNINEQMLKARKAQLERYVEVAKRFSLPHLKMLIEMALSCPHEDTSSTFDIDMKSLWTSASYTSDVSFRASSFPDHPLVHAHKAVMASRSEFLKSLLTGGMIESTQREVGLVDVSPGVIRSIVEFCYTDDVETLDPETVLELLTTSKLYGLKRLQSIVESVVGYSLDVNNVPSLLSLAWAQSMKGLARACKFFILSNWSTVTSKSDWKDVEEPIRLKLVETAKKWKVI